LPPLIQETCSVIGNDVVTSDPPRSRRRAGNRVRFFANDAPETVNNFVFLAHEKFYGAPSFIA
jgi:hypothetical protein